MEKLLFAIGILLLVLAVIAVSLYGWHGQWGAVLFVVAAATLGRFFLGVIELLLVPFSFPAIALAKRDQKFLSFCFMSVASLATKSAYAAFCIIILIYLMSTPGPSAWLVITLSVLVAGAPFAWAAQRASDNQAPNIDTIAATLGVLASGVLFLFGVSPFFSVAPVVGLFLISSLIHIFWWLSTGMRQTRYEALIDGSV